MHERQLARAAYPKQAVILSVALRPYSLGHQLLLVREENAFAPESTAEPTHYDLALAVFICSNSWAQNIKAQTEWLTGLKLSLLRWRIREKNFLREAWAFRQYQAFSDRGFRPSEITDPDRTKSTRVLGAPPILRLAQFMQVVMRKTEVEAWDYGCGLALMQWQTFYEAEGLLDIYNELEAGHDDYVAQQEKLKEAAHA